MDGTLDGLRVGANLRVGLAVGEPVVGAVVVCRIDGAGVRFTVAREVGLLEKVVVGFLVGLNERFDVGFEVGEREDGRVEGVGDGMEVEGFEVDGRAEGKAEGVLDDELRVLGMGWKLRVLQLMEEQKELQGLK